jgi:hypothetical protein
MWQPMGMTTTGGTGTRHREASSTFWLSKSEKQWNGNKKAKVKGRWATSGLVRLGPPIGSPFNIGCEGDYESDFFVRRIKAEKEDPSTS